MGIKKPIESETAARYFFYLTVVNILIAVGATAPVLDPHLGLPIKVSHWPGTWMFIAYFSFLIVGVLGMLAWSVMFYMAPRLFHKTSINKTLFWLQFVLFEVSVVGATALMGIFPGYVGGSLIQAGVAEFVVTRVVEWTVIPIGLFIGIALLSVLAGVANLMFARDQFAATGPS